MTASHINPPSQCQKSSKKNSHKYFTVSIVLSEYNSYMFSLAYNQVHKSFLGKRQKPRPFPVVHIQAFLVRDRRCRRYPC